jgi:hypothetical protein
LPTLQGGKEQVIFDVRTYDIRPGKLKQFVDVFEAYGKPVADKHGFKLICYLTTKIGRLNQVLHIWQFEDLAQWEAMRKGRDADPGWKLYREKYGDMIVRQEDKIMEGAPFSPLG